MASIPYERLLELVEIYNGLKKRILLIDEKYSLDFVEPKLDMPDSLNLTKLTYTPKSEEELMTLAKQQVAAAIISKQAILDKNHNTKIKNLGLKINEAQQTSAKRAATLQDAHTKALKDIHNRLVNNGLIFSTIKVKYESQAQEDYKTKSEKIAADTVKEIESIVQQMNNADAIYNDSCNDLEKEKAARITQAYQKLVEDEEKLARSIEKYNTGLDEKEQKYQASRAKAYESARRAAYTRAYNNSKLYLQMGETGYRRMIEKEKYAVSQDVFYPLRREEAQAILSMDSFLVSHLGTYYNAFVDWVNTTLLPL